MHSIYSVVKYFNWINMADLTFFRNKKQFSWNDYVTSQYFSYIGEVSFMVGENTVHVSGETKLTAAIQVNDKVNHL